MHSLLRWPLFLLVTVAVAGLLLIYTLVRYCVLAAESLLETNKIRKYLRRLAKAANLHEYRRIARHLDSAAGLDVWKKTGESPFFSLKLVESHTHALLLAK